MEGEAELGTKQFALLHWYLTFCSFTIGYWNYTLILKCKGDGCDASYLDVYAMIIWGVCQYPSLSCFLCDSSVSCSNNIVAVLVFVVNIPAHWYHFFTDFMFIIFFPFSMIIVQFFVWCWLFMCWVVYKWFIVYVIIIIACACLILKLCYNALQ